VKVQGAGGGEQELQELRVLAEEAVGDGGGGGRRRLGLHVRGGGVGD
jgi:hypothetical protein